MLIGQRVRGVVVLFVVALSALSGHAAAEEVARSFMGLPAKECVQLLRSAHIAGMQGDYAGELAKLQEALEAFPEELTPVFAMFEYQRIHGRTADRDQDLRATLARRLNESAQTIAPAVVFQLIMDPKVDLEILALLEEHLRERTRPGDGHAPPVEADLLVALSRIQIRLGLDEAAVSTLMQLSKQDGPFYQLWSLLAVLDRLERWSEQADLLQKMVDSGTPDLSFHLLLALAKAGRLEEAIALVETITAQFESPEERSEAPGAQQLEEQIAWQSLQKDSSQVATFQRTVTQLGWIARDQGKDEAAEQLFRMALALREDDEATQAVLLHLYGSREEQAHMAAVEAERRATETDPQTLLDEGTHLLATGDVEAAIALLKRAAPNFPDLEAVWYNLAMAGYRLGDWSTAESAFAKAAQLNPDRAQSYYFRGISLVQSNRCPEAIDPLLQALQLDATRTQAHYYLARCYREIGNNPEAERHKKLYEASKE